MLTQSANDEGTPMTDNYRHAVIENGHDKLLVIRAYLPSNYGADSDGKDVYLHGIDVAGWTLDGYVLPRLASGLYFGYEVVADGNGEYVRVVND